MAVRATYGRIARGLIRALPETFGRVSPHGTTTTACDDVRMARTAVIVDDHEDFRARATELLEAAGYEIIGSCPDGETDLAVIASARPDVVLLDVQLPDVDGFGVVSRIEPPPAGPAVVLVSTREAADYGGRVARSGAAGFITKSELSADSLARVVGYR